MTIQTNTHYNFTKAENETFAWDQFDQTNGGILTHKPTGRQIYQMSWLDAQGYMAEKVEGQDREQAIAFWNELDTLQHAREEELRREAMEQHQKDAAAIEAEEQLMRWMDDPNSDY